MKIRSLALLLPVINHQHGNNNRTIPIKDRLSQQFRQSQGCFFTCARAILEYDAYDVLLNVFYLPTLKDVVGHYKLWSEVMFWFTQMMCYNVYVPLLIRQANDVEENPGPTIYDIIDPTTTVSADFSQGNGTLFGVNAGKQCVAMSLTAIIYHQIQDISLWTNSTLNNILVIGNNLYSTIRCSVQSNDYLLLTDVPDMVSIFDKVYSLQYSESFTGSLFMTSNIGPYRSLRNSLLEVFSHYQWNYSCLLTIGVNTVEVFKNSEQSFKIFDSHSRDLYGMPDSFGKCTLVCIEGLENVVSFFQMSCPETGAVPFEMKGVRILISAGKTDMRHVQQDPKSDHIYSSNENDAKSIDNRKQKCTTEISKIKENQLIARREYEKKRKANESPEAREKRLAGKRESNRKRRATENQETRKKRLASQQEYYKKKCASENAECREKRLASMRTHQKEKRANESAECREKRLAKQREYDQRNNVNVCNSPTVADEIRKFHTAVSSGPLYICSCCDQLWYKHSVTAAKKLRISNPGIVKYLLSKTSVDDVEWICQSCFRYLKKNKIPPYAAKNGMSFPLKPDFFDLNELECRLLAPRLAFQKLMQAPRGNQLKIKGNIVNVPADVNNTVNVLPRLPQESGTIKVQLKRRLQYKSSALSLNVRRYKILQAANWLAANSALYREQGVSFSENRISSYNVNMPRSETDTVNLSQVDYQMNTSCNVEDTANECKQLDDGWTEVDAEIPAGITDTMLTATDFLEDSERAQIYSITPGEGNRPLSLFRDTYSEELAYPGIYSI